MLEKETGKKITFTQATDYASVIEGQRASKIDIAVYGPFSYVIAKDGGVQVEPIGAMVDKEGAKPGLRVMQLDEDRPSPIADIKDFKGKEGLLR